MNTTETIAGSAYCTGATGLKGLKQVTLHLGDCLEVMRTLPDNSVDSIVTDPPAGIAFMGKDWDKDKGGRAGWVAWMSEVATECLRVIKPGGHALVWAIPRTSHWTGTAWELAGWKPRDKVYHVFGSGFPKSANVSKLIDKAAGAVRVPVLVPTKKGNKEDGRGEISLGATGFTDVSRPVCEAARQWEGWGTALKPAVEEWWLMRKPLIGTVADNVLQHGTGAINVDGCRVAVDGEENPSLARRAAAGVSGKCGSDMDSWQRRKEGLPVYNRNISLYVNGNPGEALGRWPANLIHDGSEEVVAGFPLTSASKDTPRFNTAENPVNDNDPNASMLGRKRATVTHGHTDAGGSASRFFYCSKASKKDRDEGLDGFESIARANGNKWTDQDYRVTNGERPPSAESGPRKNTHPTVKPERLMRYLCRLITPPGGIVLDPFMGSGSTGKGAILEGFDFIGIEREPDYLAIAQARIQAAQGATTPLPTPSVNQGAFEWAESA